MTGNSQSMIIYLHQAIEVVWAGNHIVRTEDLSDSASNPISSEEWLQLIRDDKALSMDNKKDNFFAIWSGPGEHDEPWLNWLNWLNWSNGRIYTKHPDEALYCKMLEIAGKLNAVVVDDNDRKYALPSDLLNPPWAKTSSVALLVFEGKASFIDFLYHNR